MRAASPDLPVHQQDETDANNLYDLLENEIIPIYYDDAAKWIAIVKNAMRFRRKPVGMTCIFLGLQLFKKYVVPDGTYRMALVFLPIYRP